MGDVERRPVPAGDQRRAQVGFLVVCVLVALWLSTGSGWVLALAALAAAGQVLLWLRLRR